LLTRIWRIRGCFNNWIDDFDQYHYGTWADVEMELLRGHLCALQTPSGQISPERICLKEF